MGLCGNLAKMNPILKLDFHSQPIKKMKPIGLFKKMVQTRMKATTATMLECKKVLTFLLSVLISDWLKQQKLRNLHKAVHNYIHPYFPSIFHITKSALSLDNTEILCGEHVKL